jgi:magnesium-protoporphyrin IX monomethyl ester (oxidative) cyclase
MGVDVDDYDRRVIALTNQISRQVFPVVLDVENDRAVGAVRALHQNTPAHRREARRRAGLANKLRAAALRADCGVTFLRAYLVRPVENAPPADVRMQPVW